MIYLKFEWSYLNLRSNSRIKWNSFLNSDERLKMKPSKNLILQMRSFFYVLLKQCTGSWQSWYLMPCRYRRGLTTKGRTRGSTGRRGWPFFGTQPYLARQVHDRWHSSFEKFCSRGARLCTQERRYKTVKQKSAITGENLHSRLSTLSCALATNLNSKFVV